MPTDPDNERLGWGDQDGHQSGEGGWAEDTTADDDQSGLIRQP